MGEEKLQKEIQYLTRLIESHKAAGNFSVSNQKVITRNQSRPNRSEQYKWNNIKVNSTSVANTSKFAYKSTSQNSGNNWRPYALSSKVSKRTKPHGNLVYRPAVSTDNGSSTTVASGSGLNLRSATKETRTLLKNEAILTKTRTNTSSHSPRCRKRKASKTKDLTPILKKQKSKYVWKASTESTSSLNGCKLPNKRQLKWRRPSLDKKQPRKNENALRVNSHTSSKSSGRTPLKSRYKWKRRTSQDSKIHASPWKVPQSPLVATGKYSLVRSSLLQKHMHSKNQNSFQYRRLKYIIKHSPSRLYTNHAIERRTNSKNRVWIASSDGDHTKVTDFQHLHKSKLHQGNKVWTGDVQGSLDSRKASTMTSLVSFGDCKYMLDSSKRRLKRTSTSHLSSISSNTSQASVKNYLASCAVQRSRKHIWLGKKHKNKVLNKFKHYCIFFNRFGKCSRGDNCPYVHDPQRVAVCPKFLKGTCEKTDGTCLLSHKAKKEKMPVCSFFLRGVCTRDTCPYLHVSVDRNASVCPDFITGYCPRGEQCMLQHILDCPEFLNTGQCSKGKTCLLRHYKRRKQKDVTTSNRMPTRSVKTPMAFKKVNHKRDTVSSEESQNITSEKTVFTSELEFIPLDCDQAPDFIAL